MERACRSKVATADALIVTGDSEFHGIVIEPDGANALTVAIYDNTSAAGTKILPTFTVTATSYNTRVLPIHPIHCINGIYVDVTVAGGGTVEYAVLYKKL